MTTWSPQVCIAGNTVFPEDLDLRGIPKSIVRDVGSMRPPMNAEIAADFLFYGAAFMDSSGRRIDPRHVRVCPCGCGELIVPTALLAKSAR